MFILNTTPSLVNKFLAELRDIDSQKDRMRFRHNLKRLGFLMAYEISKSLTFHEELIQTPLDTTKIQVPENVVIISVLRAAAPFYDGFLEAFDHAESGFVGAYRIESKEMNDGVDVDYLYQACPSLEGKTVIIVDPMLATGKSFVKTFENLLKNGLPKTVHIASVIAAPEGVALLKQQLQNYSVNLWTCALDSHLNEHSYIVPGLGDAGDLAFGEKL
ncbi:uracil phosphoribosyltransferase [Mongoliitalea daihaiensis]|uniref:uracil phosphoribosyltransferase n=1 Tax=Mongoliitalea daihaiensis TaxID=2782006 RepID=UPI001F3D08DA|nr:uracil phosphoribosyltransferase [Mongoliitalea daihaiensis]UJP65587.1 uracil phosphoribosyltransferase [Mongoliitalea daihaiensis]